MPYTISFSPYSKLGDSEKRRLAQTAVISAMLLLALLAALVLVNLPSRPVSIGMYLLLVPLASAMPWKPATSHEWLFCLTGVAYLASVAVLVASVDRLWFDFSTKEGESVQGPPGPLFVVALLAGILAVVMAISFALHALSPALTWLDQP